jgi:hypothetical protein
MGCQPPLSIGFSNVQYPFRILQICSCWRHLSNPPSGRNVCWRQLRRLSAARKERKHQDVLFVEPHATQHRQTCYAFTSLCSFCDLGKSRYALRSYVSFHGLPAILVFLRDLPAGDKPLAANSGCQQNTPRRTPTSLSSKKESTSEPLSSFLLLRVRWQKLGERTLGRHG